MDSAQKNYELAYLISPSLSDEDALAYTQGLNAVLEGAKGIIRHVEVPKKRQLAYPIRKERHAYFGWITFSFPGSEIQKISKELKNSNKLLRFLITEEQEISAPRRYPSFLNREHTTEERRHPIAPGEKKDHLDLEALDKKLEEILGQ